MNDTNPIFLIHDDDKEALRTLTLKFILNALGNPSDYGDYVLASLPEFIRLFGDTID